MMRSLDTLHIAEICCAVDAVDMIDQYFGGRIWTDRQTLINYITEMQRGVNIQEIKCCAEFYWHESVTLTLYPTHYDVIDPATGDVLMQRDLKEPVLVLCAGDPNHWFAIQASGISHIANILVIAFPNPL